MAKQLKYGEEARRALEAGMNALADTVFLSGLKDEAIRFSFGIESLWQ